MIQKNEKSVDRKNTKNEIKKIVYEILKLKMKMKKKKENKDRNLCHKK